ncbi:MAG TPA: DoxX family membrane protein [Actinoplanes sp.]|nr:DoxX family membrane protein [Actinoplanes sp.]
MSTTPKTALDPSPAAVPAAHRATRWVLAALRLALGWVFLWAFLDKLFGLGLATPSAKSWLNGGSPTKGFLSSVEGPFEGFYHAIAGDTWTNVLFMAALAGVGLALVLGIGLRVAAISGGVLLVMMWTAALPLENNPFIDDHLVYAGVLALFPLTAAGHTLGLGGWWAKLPIVQRLPWLQ